MCLTSIFTGSQSIISLFQVLCFQNTVVLDYTVCLVISLHNFWFESSNSRLNRLGFAIVAVVLIKYDAPLSMRVKICPYPRGRRMMMFCYRGKTHDGLAGIKIAISCISGVDIQYNPFSHAMLWKWQWFYWILDWTRAITLEDLYIVTLGAAPACCDLDHIMDSIRL